MSQSIRKKLGKEQYELIKTRNKLLLYIDCSEFYGENGFNIQKMKEEVKGINDKINALKILRDTLKNE